MSESDPYDGCGLTFTSFRGADGPMAQVTIESHAFWQGHAAELDRACFWWLAHRGWIEERGPAPVIEGYCLCGHQSGQHSPSACWAARTCHCGGFVQRDVPMPGPLKADGSY